MYDTDWNPQQDLQAQARAHRMGQERDVRVVRLVTADSIEEHVVKVAATKRDVADASITGMSARVVATCTTTIQQGAFSMGPPAQRHDVHTSCSCSRSRPHSTKGARQLLQQCPTPTWLP